MVCPHCWTHLVLRLEQATLTLESVCPRCGLVGLDAVQPFVGPVVDDELENDPDQVR